MDGSRTAQHYEGQPDRGVRYVYPDPRSACEILRVDVYEFRSRGRFNRDGPDVGTLGVSAAGLFQPTCAGGTRVGIHEGPHRETGGYWNAHIERCSGTVMQNT